MLGATPNLGVRHHHLEQQGKEPAASEHRHNPQEATRRKALLQEMARGGTLDHSQLALVNSSLKDYPLKDLEALRKEGVKIAIASDEQIAHREERSRKRGRDAHVLGFYDMNKKVVYLRDSATKDADAGHVIRHEVGHAVDDVRSRDNSLLDNVANVFKDVFGGEQRGGLQSQNNEEFKNLFADYKNRTKGLRKEGGQLWSSYARINAHEYYAEGMAFYNQGESGRRKLQKADPKLTAISRPRERARSLCLPALGTAAQAALSFNRAPLSAERTGGFD